MSSSAGVFGLQVREDLPVVTSSRVVECQSIAKQALYCIEVSRLCCRTVGRGKLCSDNCGRRNGRVSCGYSWEAETRKLVAREKWDLFPALPETMTRIVVLLLCNFSDRCLKQTATS